MKEMFATPAFEGFGLSRVMVHGEPLQPVRVYAQGLKKLREEVRAACPNTPGVYGMVDGAGKLIYVGKSKRLRTRLLSYFRAKDPEDKAVRIMSHTVSILWEPQPHDFTALLRELELIRRFRPRYNVRGQPGRLRRSFIVLGRAPAPYLFYAQRPTGNMVDCFGPFVGSWLTRECVRYLNDWFQLRDCTQQQALQFSDQKELFPVERTAGCLRYEIGTCLGPCVAGCSKIAYGKKVKAVRAFLSLQDPGVLQEVVNRMRAMAEKRDFERAATLRDTHSRLSMLCERLQRLREAREQYAFIYPLPDPDSGVVWYLIRGGQVEAACRPPRNRTTARTAIKLLRSVYEKPAAQTDPHLLETFDQVLLVAQWFEANRAELDNTISPEDALMQCRQWCERPAEVPAKVPARRTAKSPKSARRAG